MHQHPSAARRPRDAHGNALVHRSRRPYEPRRVWNQLAAGLVADVRQDVHVRPGHADAAWRDFSPLYQRKHSTRR